MAKKVKHIPIGELKTYEELETALVSFAIANEVAASTVRTLDPLWFVALQQADEWSEGFSRKDIASMLLQGMPKLTKEGVNEWLDVQYQDEEPCLYDFDSMFKSFFGVR